MRRLPNLFHRIAFAVLVSSALALPAAAADRRVPQDFATVQEAIDAAGSGDEVVVDIGVYLEAIDLRGKSIVVRSTNPTDPGVVATTIIDATGRDDSVVKCRSGETAATELRGLTFRGGTGSPDEQGEIVGGGLHVFQSQPTVVDCRFENNSSQEDGGAIYVDAGAPVIRRTVFLANAASDDGGAIAVRGQGEIRLEECEFSDNVAVEDGGAIRIRSGALTIDGCAFLGNSANAGGALDIHDTDAVVEINDSFFCENDPNDVTGPFSGQGNTFAGTCDADRDGDGLADLWETVGIPYFDPNGVEQFYELEGADPDHKDLFVEVDVMAGPSFTEEARLDVEFAFAIAPVANPDGNDGIKLHIVIDEEDLAFEAVTASEDGEFPPLAAITRLNHFGTRAERARQDRFQRLEAKAKAYRYCLVFFKSSRKIGGHAELGGDDMILYVGGYDDEERAAVFMHELGHCLGLHHGGGLGITDETLRKVNGKPNYPSVMNYVLAYKEDWNETFWQLDYWREKLATIDENDISELVSVGADGEGLYDDFFMPFHGIVPVGAECYDQELWGESLISYADLDPSVLTDLNLDCDTDDEQFDADLNFVPGSALPGSEQASPGETLEGHDDWSNLVLPVDDGGGLFAGREPEGELTDDQRAYMRENFPPPPAETCRADLDDSGVVDFDDLLAVLSAWGEFAAPEDLDGNGYVDFGDLLIVLGSWGACS